MNFVHKKELTPAESLYEGLRSYQNATCIVSFGQMKMEKAKEYYESAMKDYIKRIDVFCKERYINNVFETGRLMKISSVENDFTVHFGYINNFVFMHSCLDEEGDSKEIEKLVQTYL